MVNIQDLPPEQLAELERALREHALLARLDGSVHALVRDGNIWRVRELGSNQEYVVDGDDCTCGEVKCKHVRGVKYGSDTYNTPWKYKSLKKKRRKRGRDI